MPEGRLTALQHGPRVAYVAEDLARSIDEQYRPTGMQRIFADTNPEIAIDSAYNAGGASPYSNIVTAKTPR